MTTKTDRERAEELADKFVDAIIFCAWEWESTKAKGILADMIEKESAFAEIRKECEAGWRDISTAPKDGTRILLHCSQRVSKKSGRIMQCSRTAIGYWRDGEEATDVNPHRRELTVKHGGYWTTHFKGMQPIKGLPTHWMPLPQPPKEA